MKSHTDARRGGLTRRVGFWAALALLGVSGLYWQARSDTPAAQSSAPVKTTVRTARVRSGEVQKTLRLTGTVRPERFSSMLAPQMRGSRGGPRGGGGGGGGSRGGGGGSSSGGGGGSSSGGSGGSGSSSSASTGASAASSGSGASGASAGTTAGAGANLGTGAGTSSLRTALSRFSSGSGSSSSSSSGSSRTSTSSASTSTGSSSGSSGGGGGGGGGGYSYGSGGGDFNLILQSAVPAGSRVTKGQVIAEFDRLNMLNRLDDFRDALDNQATGLKTLQTSLDVEKKAHQQSIENAKSALDKARLDLKTIPVQSDMTIERLKLAAEEAQARYNQLLKEVKHKEAAQAAEYRIAKLEYDEAVVQFKRIEANVDRMVIRAPMDGITVMGTTFRGSEFSQIQPGDEVRPGMMFVQVVDPASMVVNAVINQVDVDSIRIGMKANVRFDAYPDLQLPARVHSIAAMPKTGGPRAAYVKEIPVVLKLEKMDPRVIPDLSVSADVIVESTPGVTYAPVETVFRDAKSGEAFVFVQAGAGWQRRSVQTGPVNNIAAVIRSGVRPGEVLAAEWPTEEKGK